MCIHWWLRVASAVCGCLQFLPQAPCVQFTADYLRCFFSSTQFKNGSAAGKNCCFATVCGSTGADKILSHAETNGLWRQGVDCVMCHAERKGQNKCRVFTVVLKNCIYTIENKTWHFYQSLPVSMKQHAHWSICRTDTQHSSLVSNNTKEGYFEIAACPMQPKTWVAHEAVLANPYVRGMS